MTQFVSTNGAPRIVVDIANVMPIGHEVSRLLLSDPRMEIVWKTLRQTDVSEDAIKKLESRFHVEHWGLLDQQLSLQDQAAAAFFVRVLLTHTIPRPVLTISQAQKTASDWKHAADVFSQFASEGMFPLELKNAVIEASNFLKTYAASFKKTGYPFDDETGKRRAVPYVLSRSSGKKHNHNITRARGCEIALFCMELFGAEYRGTVAIACMVAGKLKKEITDQTIRNWTNSVKRATPVNNASL